MSSAVIPLRAMLQTSRFIPCFISPHDEDAHQLSFVSTRRKSCMYDIKNGEPGKKLSVLCLLPVIQTAANASEKHSVEKGCFKKLCHHHLLRPPFSKYIATTSVCFYFLRTAGGYFSSGCNVSNTSATFNIVPSPKAGPMICIPTGSP